MIIKCPKCGGALHWHPAINEEGWRCCVCDFKPGEPSGYAPHLDVVLIEVKVNDLLHDLHGRDLVYMSNNDHADGLVGIVARRCAEANRYDQYTICRLIFEVDGASHGNYWAKIGDGVRSGNDPRDRCAGGSLANGWTGDLAWCNSSGCACGGMGGLDDDVPF